MYATYDGVHVSIVVWKSINVSICLLVFPALIGTTVHPSDCEP